MRKEIIGNATLYLADCRDVMAGMEDGSVDAVVTDPPYGIGINKSTRLSVSRGFGSETWDEHPADVSGVVALKLPAVIWGGNYFDLPPCRGFLVWDKRNDGRDFADVELAWTNLDMVARQYRFRPMNMDGGKEHPTQKPIALMKWCLSFIPDTKTIFDPFMGSGSTGVACIELGKKFIGVEIEPKYFDIACKRIDMAVRQGKLF